MDLRFTWFFRVRVARLTLLSILIAGFSLSPVTARQGGDLRREHLLNGLDILMLPAPGDPNFVLKLRIRGGAAFDRAGKAGTMALLGDALFPDPTLREYFADELGGRLEVSTSYDAIDVTLSAKATNFERVVGLLATALTNTTLQPEVVARLREARLKVVKDSAVAPAILADRAIAARFFGSFPYGRPFGGGLDSLPRVERADVMLARDRFLNPNNSILVLVGGVEQSRAMKTFRQLLGPWHKSEAVAPLTFRQPDPPDGRTLILDVPGAETAEVRFAVRGLARTDTDLAAATILALIARDRWPAAAPGLARGAYFVRHEVRSMPGLFVMGASVSPPDAAGTLDAARRVTDALASQGASADEVQRAKADALAAFRAQIEKPATLADLWLDAETAGAGSIDDYRRALESVTPADVQRVAQKMFGTAKAATVAVGSAARLRPEFGRASEVGGPEIPPAPTNTPDRRASPRE